MILGQQNSPARQTLDRTLILHIYAEGKNYSDRKMEKPGRSDHLSTLN